jgi:hypothetical protein
MTDTPERLADLPQETRDFLSELSKDDLTTLRNGIPIVKAIIGFGKVTKWLAITALGLLAGTVLLWESVLKILGWLKGAQ